MEESFMTFRLSEKAYHTINLPGKMGQKSESILADQTMRERIEDQIQQIEQKIPNLKEKDQRAMLYYEIGLIWKDRLGDLRNAMIYFQKSYEEDESFSPSLRIVREIFEKKQHWDFVLNIVASEIAHIKDPDEYLYLMTQKSNILSHHKDNQEGAEKVLKELSQKYPDSQLVLQQMKSFYRKQNDEKQYLEILKKFIKERERLSDSVQEFVLIDLITFGLSKKMLPFAEVSGYISDVMTLKEHWPLSLEDIDWISVADRFEKEIFAKKEVDPEQVYVLYKLFQNFVKRPDRANRFLVNNYQHIDKHLLLLDKFEEIYSHNGNIEKLIDVKRRKAIALKNPRERAVLFQEIGQVALDFGNKKIAEKGFRQALDLDAHNLMAIKGLIDLYRKNNQKEQLVVYMIKEIDFLEDGFDRAVAYYKIGQVFETSGDDEQCEAYYLKALNEDPQYWVAVERLCYLYKRKNAWKRFIDTAKQLLSGISDRKLIVSIKFDIAVVYLEQLNMIDAAQNYFLDLFKNFPFNYQVIEYLERILKEKKDWKTLLKLNEKVLKEVSERSRKLTLLMDMASISIEHLDKEAQGIKYLQEILAEVPNYLPALSQLKLIYERKKEWQKLVKLLEQEHQIAKIPEKKAVTLYQIGEVYRTELNDEKRSIQYYEAILKIMPGYLKAISRLEELYLKHQRSEHYIQLLETRSEQVQNTTIKANYHCKIGEFYWENKRFDQAVSSFQKALVFQQNNRTAYFALKGIYLKQKGYDQLFELFNGFKDFLDLYERAEAYFELAQICYFYKNELEKSETLLFHAISLKPSKYHYQLLVKIYFETDRINLILKIKDQYLFFLNHQEKIEFYHHIITYVENQPEPKYTPVKEYVELYNLTPKSYLFYKLFNILNQNALWNDLNNLIQDRLKHHISDLEKADLYYQLGQVVEHYLNKPKSALKYYEKATKINEAHFLAIQAEKKIYEQTGQLEKLLDILKKEASATDASPDVKYESLFQNAKILLFQLKKVDEGIALLKTILIEHPLHEKAFKILYEHYISNKMYNEALNIIDGKIKASDNKVIKENILLQKVSFITKYIKDIDRIIDTYEQLVDLNPKQTTAYVELINAFEEKKDYKKLLKYCQLALGETLNQNQEKRVMKGIFKAYVHFHDIQNAVAIGQQLLDQNYLDYQEGMSLLNLYKKNRQHRQAFALLEKLLKYAPDKDKPGVLMEILEFQKKELPEREWERKAMFYIEQYRYPSLLFYYADFLAERSLKDAINFLEDYLPKFQDPAIKFEITKNLGKICAKFQDITKSIHYYTKAFELNPNDMEVLETLRRIYLSNSDYHDKILKYYPELIQKNGNYLFLIEDLFTVYQKQNKKSVAYTLSSMIDFFDLDHATGRKFQRDHILTNSSQFNIYESSNILYLFYDYDRLDLRKLLALSLEGIGKVFRKTVSDYGHMKLEELTFKGNSYLYDLFQELREKFDMPFLKCYIKEEESVVIDYIFPDNLAIILPSSMVQMEGREIAFYIGRALDRIRSWSFLTEYYSPQQVVSFIKAVINYTLDQDVFEDIDVSNLQKGFAKGVSRNLKKSISSFRGMFSRTSWYNVDLDSYLKHTGKTCNRVGLLACNNTGDAIKGMMAMMGIQLNPVTIEEAGKAAQESPELKELLLYMMDERYNTLRDLLGIRVMPKNR